MQTLGITKEKQYRKVDIATAQLTESINMFLTEKYLFSISLAGAAEEIFAGLVRSQGGEPVIELAYRDIEDVRNSKKLSLMGEKNKREIIKTWNHVKNRTKHHDDDESETITFNECDEDYWLIKRALCNATMLGVKVSIEDEFDNFVISKACL